MPSSMDLSSYRREYSDWRAAVERERYRHHAGLTPELSLEPLRERYSDLWSREAINELQQKLDDTSVHFETERAGLNALAVAAQLEYAEDRASEVTAELTRCETSARISWGGEEIGAADARALIAREQTAARRRELDARLSDALRPCEDLRAARLDALDDAARELGLASLRALHERASSSDFDSLAAQADSFLEHTASVYRSRLARWASREVPSGPGMLSRADEPFFARAAWLDIFLASRNARNDLDEVRRDLGMRAGGGRSVFVDDEARPLKNPRPACFGVRPPEEVFLVTGGSRGADSYLDFFFEAGRAQHFVWSSTDMDARHPEFTHAPDDAARCGAGLLIRSLFRDFGWVGPRLDMRETDASALARDVALLELWDVRRCCASLCWARARGAAAGTGSEQLSEIYVDLYAEATGFRPDAVMQLADAEGAYGAAVRLRAWLLAASLREHLRERYGRRWYSSRAAGDELIDIWNTGLRYTGEELVRLAWGGSLDFDLLADELRTALVGD